MDIRNKILELCKEKDLSLSQLAIQSGLSESTTYGWYKQKPFNPSLRAIEDICAVFEISLAQFFSDVDFNDPTPQEIELLETFRKIPDEKKEAILNLIKTFVSV